MRGAPIRLRGESAAFVQENLEAEAKRGLYERGTSPWGSWAFPTRESASGRKRRVVVDYRRVNQRILRAVYYRRRAEDVKAESAGSVYYSLFDAVKGFNQVPNSERARRVLAVLANSGCFLPRVLTLGPCNGPEDFQMAVDTLFALGPRHRRRLCKQWQVYIDDFCVRSGRWRNGFPISDEAYAEAMAAARPKTQAPRALGEALSAAGFRSHATTDGEEATDGRGPASKADCAGDGPSFMAALPPVSRAVRWTCVAAISYASYDRVMQLNRVVAVVVDQVEEEIVATVSAAGRAA